MPAYCPDAGDIIWLDFDPPSGSEQRGRRPALVLSPRSYNRPSRLCVLCPITSQRKSYPFEVPIPAGHPVAGVVLADQVKNHSWEMRDAEFMCVSPPGVLQTTKGMIRALLQIP